MTAWIEPGDPPGKAPQLEPWEGMPSRAPSSSRATAR